MKEVKHYICEICNTEYNDKAKAQLCENGHCQAKEIVSARFQSLKDNQKGYPISIDVKMADGKVITYKR